MQGDTSEVTTTKMDRVSCVRNVLKKVSLEITVQGGCLALACQWREDSGRLHG